MTTPCVGGSYSNLIAEDILNSEEGYNVRSDILSIHGSGELKLPAFLFSQGGGHVEAESDVGGCDVCCGLDDFCDRHGISR